MSEELDIEAARRRYLEKLLGKKAEPIPERECHHTKQWHRQVDWSRWFRGNIPFARR